MIYAIIASEGMYQGSHGIEHKEIVQVRDLEEAHEIGTEMSIEIMNSYSFIYEELEEEIQNEINNNDTVKWTDKRIEELRKEVYDSNVYYDLYELDEEKIKNISEDELEDEFYNDIDEFLNKYQKEDIIL